MYSSVKASAYTSRCVPTCSLFVDGKFMFFGNTRDRGGSCHHSLISRRVPRVDRRFSMPSQSLPRAVLCHIVSQYSSRSSPHLIGLFPDFGVCGEVT